MIKPQLELEYLEKSLNRNQKPILINQIKQGIKNLKLMQGGARFCPYCSCHKPINGAFQFIGYWVKMDLVRTQGSRGLRIDNIKKWESSGIDRKKLPNSEWYDYSFVRYDWECPECCHKEVLIPEQKTILVSDGEVLE